MQTFEEEVDDRVVEDHGREADNRQPRRTVATPPARRAGVNVAGEERPDNEGPDLFGVPAPVAAPRALGPDSAGDEREGPEDEADDVEAIGEAL